MVRALDGGQLRFRLAVMGGAGSPAGTIFSPLQAYCRAADADPLNVVSRMKIPAAARNIGVHKSSGTTSWAVFRTGLP
jgi:hypothetical protein